MAVKKEKKVLEPDNVEDITLARFNNLVNAGTPPLAAMMSIVKGHGGGSLEREHLLTLGDRMVDLRADVNKHGGRLDKLEEDLGELAEVMGDTCEALGNWFGDDDGLISGVAKLQTQVSNLAGNIEAQLPGINADLRKLEDQSADASSVLRDHRHELTGLQQRMRSLELNTAEVSHRHGTNAQLIADIHKLAANETGMLARISGMDHRLTMLDERLDMVEDDIGSGKTLEQYRFDDAEDRSASGEAQHWSTWRNRYADQFVEAVANIVDNNVTYHANSFNVESLKKVGDSIAADILELVDRGELDNGQHGAPAYMLVPLTGQCRTGKRSPDEYRQAGAGDVMDRDIGGGLANRFVKLRKSYL